MVRRLELGCCHIHGGDTGTQGLQLVGPGPGWPGAGGEVALVLERGRCAPLGFEVSCSVEMTSQTWTHCVTLSITAASGLCLQDPVKALPVLKVCLSIHRVKESVSEHLIVGSFVAA